MLKLYLSRIYCGVGIIVVGVSTVGSGLGLYSDGNMLLGAVIFGVSFPLGLIAAFLLAKFSMYSNETLAWISMVIVLIVGYIQWFVFVPKVWAALPDAFKEIFVPLNK